MPLFSDHISNMYYSGSPLYSSSSYGYNSSVLPLGSSYSASYLNPGGNYSNHSSLGSYSRTPLTSRWISGVGRSYSPMLSTISERSAASPVRINSPRRIPITKRSYGSSGYITRPININTADIDVSKDKYRKKTESPVAPLPQRKESPRNEREKENSPFMPRVDGKPETGIDSSPGVPRSTIKRGRTVVRLHTIRRKDRDSPRKPVQSSQNQENTEKTVEKITQDSKHDSQESTSWRERLSDDLIYKDKKDKKTIGTKLAEKFMVKDINKEDGSEKASVENNLMDANVTQSLPVTPIPGSSKSPDRRCSVEILAEQAKLLDSLIRKENLSTAPLDISKVGTADKPKNDVNCFGPIKRRKSNDKHNPLKTTQSDHSLHDSLKSSYGLDSSKNLSKRRSLKKSSSGGSICRLDSITEFPKEPLNINLPAIDETKPEVIVAKPRPKLKTKITSSVEVSPPKSPLKFRIDDVVVEEKPRIAKKGITFSSTVDEIPTQAPPPFNNDTTVQNQKNKKITKKILQPELPSPEPEDGNFWNKIGKRETIYLMKRKQILQEAKEKHKQPFFWSPEVETFDENEAEKDKDAIQNDSGVINTSAVDDNMHSENMLSSIININTSDNLSAAIPKKLDNTTLTNSIITESFVNENELKNSESENISININTPKRTSEDNDAVKDKNIETLRQKENNSENLTTNEHSKDSIVNKEIDQSCERGNILKPEKTGSSKSDDGLKNKKIKESSLKDQVSTIAQPRKSSLKDQVLTTTKPKESSLKEQSSTNARTKKSSLKDQVTTKAQLKESSLKEQSSTTAQPKKSSLKDQVATNAQPNESSLKEQPSATAQPKQSSLKDQVATTAQPKELSLKEQSSKFVQPKESSLKQQSSTTAQSKKSSLKDQVTTTAQPKELSLKEQSSTNEQPKVSSLKEHTLKAKETSLKDISKYNGKKEQSQNQEQNLKIKVTKQSSREKDEVQSTCASAEIISVECISMQELESDKKVFKQKSEADKDKHQIEENSKSVIDAAIKKDNYTKLNKTEEQDSIMNLPNIGDADKLNEKTEADKPPKVKDVEAKTKSTPTKLKSAEKKESTNKSASNKISEKITTTKSLDSLSKESEITKDTKICQQDNQKSSCSKWDHNIKTSEKPIEILQNSAENQSSSLFNKDLMQKHEESSASHLEDSNAKKSNDDSVSSTSNIPDIHVVIEDSENIPINEVNLKSDAVEKKTEQAGTKLEAEAVFKKDAQEDKQPVTEELAKLPNPTSAKKPVKQEAALRPLIATPRPLQKRPPQVIHSSESSDSSSEEETSDEEDDECEASEGSEEFFECEANPDGRTSTGSNDSGFDSSAPTSPAGFQQIRKDCDVNCHRKCEKLTANLCGVNQRLLVEALATRTASKKGADVPGTSTSIAVPNSNSTDILEQELEQSTAYGIFRKTGRFTPPARSIPRFRKYTIEDFHFIKVLGKGSFGKVLLAELRDTEYYYAVKCLKKDVVLEDDDVECTLIERKVLALGTNHPYLCHLFATFQTDSHLFFVMEYLNGGDLMFHIQQSGRFPEARARFYAAEIVSGLKFLHKRGIIYRDLKLDNILLDFDGHVRIADFGMCKLQIYLDKTADTFCGTPDYMAPEIIKGLKYNQTVDWWSFGVLLYEMLIGQSPFSGCDEDELFWSICNEMPSYPRFLSQESLTILTRLLDKDARTRLGGTECMHGDIREQAFFHAIHWDRLERRDLEAPFRPRVRHPLDTQYFDRAFTGERPRLTAVEPQVLRSMDQEPFRGFSYTNPNATDR